MHILLRTTEGETGYDVPVLKMRDYSIDEIFEKHLLFLIPFYLFNFEKQFPELEANPEKLAVLRAEYVRIQDRLEQLVQDGALSELTKKAIMENAAHVLALLAKNYAAIRKEMKPVMVGRVLDYEAKRIHNAAWNNSESHTKLKALRNIMKNLNLSPEQAMSALELTEKEQAHYQKLLEQHPPQTGSDE